MCVQGGEDNLPVGVLSYKPAEARTGEGTVVDHHEGSVTGRRGLKLCVGEIKRVAQHSKNNQASPRNTHEVSIDERVVWEVIREASSEGLAIAFKLTVGHRLCPSEQSTDTPTQVFKYGGLLRLQCAQSCEGGSGSRTGHKRSV
jgi:hypothetical protein